MKRNYLLLAFGLFSSSLLFGQTVKCPDPAAWNYSPIAEPADSVYCLYFDECEEGTELRVIEVLGNMLLFGTEFHIISTDLQDTLSSVVFSEMGWGPPLNPESDRNIWSVCVDPDECYYLDIRTVEPRESIPMFIWGHSTYPYNAYDQFAPLYNDFLSDHFRVFFAAEFDPCGTIGCTDPLAENYNPFDTEDFDCQYCDGTNGVKVSSEFTFNGNTPWQIRNEEAVVASGSFSEDSPQLTELACLDTGCYEFRIYGDDYHFNEISLYTFEDSLLTTMTLTEDSEAIFPFGIGVEDCSDPDEIYGCTNPLGMNYDPEATVDDGSCDLQNDECGISLEAYLDSSEQFLIIDPDFFTTDYPVTILWNMGDGTAVFDEGLGDTYLYDTTGVYTVCATIYSWQFFENLPLCYATACIEIDAFEFGFTEGFPVFLSDGTVSTKEVSLAKELLFYPNPSADIVRVSGLKGSIDQLRVFSLDGRRIDVDLKGAYSAQGQELNISSLANGTYLVSIESAGSFYTGRLVVAK